MVSERGEQTIMVCHDAKTLAKGGFVVAGSEAFAEIVGYDQMSVV